VIARVVLPCCLCILALSCVCVPAHSGSGPVTAQAAASTKESPFACAMNVFTSAERKQHFEEFGPRLRASLTGIRELSNGYEFRFAPDPAAYEVLSAWMLQERRCCPFFDLNLRLDREGGPMSLTLTGREGVKEFIAEEFRPWFEKAGAHRS